MRTGGRRRLPIALLLGSTLLALLLAEATLPKFRPGGILIVYCGGGAGLFSAMIGGWVNGELGSQPVLREIGT